MTEISALHLLGAGMGDYSKSEVEGMICYSIPNPHPPEIDAFKRSPLLFYVTPPKQGINAETVPVLVLHGHGEVGASAYLKSLHESLALKRNVLVITVDYLGTKTMRGQLTPDLNAWCVAVINKNNERRGLPPFPFDFRDKRKLEKELFPYLKTLPPHFNLMNDPLVYFVGIAEGEHYDFGLIQTLDCLWAISILRSEFPQIDWKSLTAVGSSHGGYLATQCARFAPHTFALIINSYGWVEPYTPWMIKELLPQPKQIEGIHTVFFVENYWSQNPKSPYFLSADRLKIRSQNDPTQLHQWREYQRDSNTHYVFTHQIDDALHPVVVKDDLVKQMQALGFSLEYLKGNEPGKPVYASLDQKDKTSLKGIFFDFGTSDRISSHRILRSDFELGSKIVYACDCTRYEFDFSKKFPILSISSR